MEDRTEPDEGSGPTEPAQTDEERAADESYAAETDEERERVAAHEKEMLELGANVKGEGQIR